jgi:hypothetical protein
MAEPVANSESEATAKEEVRPISWSSFLESTPPGKATLVSEFAMPHRNFHGLFANFPRIQLHCDDPACEGVRWFGPDSAGNDISSGESKDLFCHYTCRNCGRKKKKFALLLAMQSQDDNLGIAYKYGEQPPFGPPLPARVQRLLQSDRDLLLKGRRCENQGLGVGAFAYYRRVVEDNKGRLIDEIQRVATRLGATQDLLQQLERARREVQFTKAIDDIKAALPPALLINGENPLTLLHHALSKGVHELSDEDCLELATSVRVILTEFAERMAQALKEDAELAQAVAKLKKR